MIKKKTNVPVYKFRIGSNIRKWRNIKDIKQKELANALNLSEAAVSNIENDVTNITITQLEDISQALNVSLEQLLSDPQDRIKNDHPGILSGKENAIGQGMENELLKAIIASMEKKDQQLQLIMQQLIHTMEALLQQDKFVFNGNKQVASRA